MICERCQKQVCDVIIECNKIIGQSIVSNGFDEIYLFVGEIAEDVIAKVKEIKSVGVPDSDDSFVPGPLQTTLTRRKGTITIIAE